MFDLGIEEEEEEESDDDIEAGATDTEPMYRWYLYFCITKKKCQ